MWLECIDFMEWNDEIDSIPIELLLLLYLGAVGICDGIYWGTFVGAATWIDCDCDDDVKPPFDDEEEDDVDGFERAGDWEWFEDVEFELVLLVLCPQLNPLKFHDPFLMIGLAVFGLSEALENFGLLLEPRTALVVSHEKFDDKLDWFDPEDDAELDDPPNIDVCLFVAFGFLNFEPNNWSNWVSTLPLI